MSGEQPGYDALAQTYAELFDDPFQSPLERAAVDAFTAQLPTTALGSSIVDVGCGIGHVAAHLASGGFSVTAVDPSVGMLDQARLAHPELRFTADDARLTTVDLAAVAGVVARFSLIHVEPGLVADILRDWAGRLRGGAMVLLAGQSSDVPGTHEFDHAVAAAWRWHPDTIAAALTRAGFAEVWRMLSRPADGFQRFPEFHICAALTGG